MILRFRFLATLFCSWLGGVYVSFVVCLHFFNPSSYSNLVLLNISTLEESRDNPSLIIFVSCFLICGGWFDDPSLYINWSSGFLYGQYVLLSKLNVTSKKSASVRSVTILILKSVFLKILIIFFVLYLFVASLFYEEENAGYRQNIGGMNLFGILFITIEVPIIVIFEEISRISRFL